MSDTALWLESPDAKRTIALIRLCVWTLTLVFGFIEAWSLRFTVSPDGNNYLDVASAYLRGEYHDAINAYWSPMFSWLIGIVSWIFSPSGYWETTALHLLNFAGVLLALVCFEFFFAAFLPFLKRSLSANDEHLLNDVAWWLVGYGLFFSTSLLVLTMEPTTPDVWVCAISYLAVGILLRIALHPEQWRYFAALGFVLGLAYLTKSFYFPLSFVFMITACFVGDGPRKNLSRAILASFIFALVSGPFIFAISKSKHRLTFGDAGKIGYAMFVDSIAQPTFWHGENQSGTPKHPTRQILLFPRVYEFGMPVAGSYPPTYDLSYWMEGVKPRFNVRGQLRILRQSFGTFFQVVLIQAEFAVGLLILLTCKNRLRDFATTVGRIWPLWVPPLAGCLAYSTVLVEARYIAPFIVFLWLACFSGALNLPSAISRRAALAVISGILAFTAVKTGKFFVTDLLTLSNQQNTYWGVAQALREIGIERGDKVSIIAGKAVGHWARLAGVKIVAELPLGQDEIFWRGDIPTKERVFGAFADAGARVIVVKDPPPSAMSEGWVRLGDTTFYAYLLRGKTEAN